MRVGNWFEELKLKEETGIRFYPEPTNRENSLLTKTRCIVHTAQTDPKEYKSVTHSTLRDPKTDPTYLVVDKVGPRFRRFENTVKSEIEDKVQKQTAADFKESRRLSYTTETRERISKAGFKPTLKENDLNVRIPTKTTNYATDNAITFYSHAIDSPTGEIGFPMSFVASMNPFRKNCVFSTDIVTDPIPTRTETYERPRSLPTVREYKTLLALRNRLIEHAKKVVQGNSGHRPYPGEAVRLIVSTLGKYEDEVEVSLKTIETELYNCIDHYQLSTSERYALVAAYDKHGLDSMSVFDFAVLFKRTPALRRMELINLFYGLMDPIGDGKVNVRFLREKLSSNSPHTHAFLDYIASPADEFTIVDFYDFYTYVSSEIESDDVFEDLIKDAWGSL